MTFEHILYIPTIFLLGFLTGSITGKPFRPSDNLAKESGIAGRSLPGAFVVFAIVFIGTHFFEIPRSSKALTKALNGLDIFDKKPSYTSAEVYSRMKLFPEKGRLLYQQFTYTIDILFPLTLFVFLFLLTRFVIKRMSISKTSEIGLMALPVLWLCTDFIENAIIFNLLKNFPEENELLAGSLGYVTMTKFSLLLLSIFAPTAFITLHNRRRRPSTNP